MDIVKVLAVSGSAAVLLAVLELIRRGRLKERYALLWLFSVIVMLMLSASRGLLEALAYQNNPPRHEYRLTERGKDLFDVLMTLWSYGERWNPPPDRSHQRVMHLTCGHEAQAVAHCSHCGERLRRRDVRVEPPLPVVAARHTASSLS